MPFWPYLDKQAGSGTTNGTGDATVTFPATFSSTPKVFLQGIDASARGIVLDVVSKSTTGFTVKAKKVTGLTSSTDAGHVHSIGSATTAAFVTGGTKYTASFVTGGTDPGHTHTQDYTGAPSDTSPVPISSHTHDGLIGRPTFTATVPSLTNTHTGTTNAPSATTTVPKSTHKHLALDYISSTSGPSTWASYYPGDGGPGGIVVGYVFPGADMNTGATSATTTVASSTHTHAFTTGSPTGTTTVASDDHAHGIIIGGPSGIIHVGSELHVHTNPATDSSYTGITLSTASAMTDLTFTTGSAVTAIPSATESAGGHSHTVDAPALAVDFDWLAIAL